jgi:hypothetical protein
MCATRVLPVIWYCRGCGKTAPNNSRMTFEGGHPASRTHSPKPAPWMLGLQIRSKAKQQFKAKQQRQSWRGTRWQNVSQGGARITTGRKFSEMLRVKMMTNFIRVLIAHTCINSCSWACIRVPICCHEKKPLLRRNVIDPADASRSNQASVM